MDVDIMPIVKFTSNLKQFYPELKEIVVSVSTVSALVSELHKRYPRIADYIVDESGALRNHVNVFIGSSLIKDRVDLSDKITSNDTVYVMQAFIGRLTPSICFIMSDPIFVFLP